MPEQAVIVDTDTHFTEPPDLWTSRLRSKWRDQTLHIEWNDLLEAEVWQIGDKVVSKAWTGAMWGWDEPFPSAPPRRVDAHPATYDRDARLEAMDRSGVRVAVLYPN